MTEITENRRKIEQQNRQGFLKDLFKTAREKTLPLDEENEPIYEEELMNGVFAANIIIKSSYAYLEQRAKIPLIEVRSPNDESAAEVLFIHIEDFAITLAVWKKRKKGFMPKYAYDLSIQGSGEKYQRFLDENHGNHLDFSSTENVKKLTDNIWTWKKV